MKTSRLLAIAALVAACVLGGCGRTGGWIIRPAPVDKTLEETVVKADPGLFVSDKVLVLDLDLPLNLLMLELLELNLKMVKLAHLRELRQKLRQPDLL